MTGHLPQMPIPVEEARQWRYDFQAKFTGDERGVWLDAIRAEMPANACEISSAPLVLRWSNPRGLWALSVEWQHGEPMVLSRGWGDNGGPPLSRWPLEDHSPLYLRAFLLMVGAVEP